MKKQRVGISDLFFVFSLLLMAVVPFLQGCSKGDTERKEVVAVVNEEPINLKDLEMEMALRVRQNPAYKIDPHVIDEQLNTMIDRRLMIQKAMEMGLAGNKNFVRTIQTFWEQTLIRELIEAKNREWKERLFVTEKEVRNFYKTMQDKGVVDLPPLEEIYDRLKRERFEQKRTEALEGWLKEVREEAAIEINIRLLDAYLNADVRANHDGGRNAR